VSPHQRSTAQSHAYCHDEVQPISPKAGLATSKRDSSQASAFLARSFFFASAVSTTGFFRPRSAITASPASVAAVIPPRPA
jgi:hypothetical protein